MDRNSPSGWQAAGSTRRRRDGKSGIPAWKVVPVVALVWLSAVPDSLPSQEQDVRRADALNEQVVGHYRAGEYRKAVRHAQKLLEFVEMALGPDHPAFATTLNNLAEVYRCLGDYENAKPLYRRSIAIYEATFGPGNPHAASSFYNLAELRRAVGDPVNAEMLYRRSLSIQERYFGSHHPLTASILAGLGELSVSQGDYGRAVPLQARALDICETNHGSAHPECRALWERYQKLWEHISTKAGEDFGR